MAAKKKNWKRTAKKAGKLGKAALPIILALLALL